VGRRHELTATPRGEAGCGREFENVIYRFDLAAALDYGFVIPTSGGNPPSAAAKIRRATDQPLSRWLLTPPHRNQTEVN
jgi:hypothetical protein